MKYMKKKLSIVILFAIAATLAACGNNQKTEESQNSSTIDTTSSEQVVSSSEETITSSELSSSSAPSSSKASSSSKATSAASSSVDSGLVNNQLSTSSGLVIDFKATGASISKITMKNKQIAKDGFVVGRVANRIGGGHFVLNDKEYNVSKNDGNNSLHGGAGQGGNSWRGPFATKDWTKVEQTKSSITFTIHSADKENGYPGNMDMTVKYTLSEAGELAIEYTATSDADTLCNPTNHLFMDLNGTADRNYKNINLMIDAYSYTPLVNQLPNGTIASVAGTQFDYRTESAFQGSKSYDDNYVLNGEVGSYRKVATMTGTSLGVKVDVFSDRPGLQLYKDGSGNICLETQMFPDMINRPEFSAYGTTILKAGEEFHSKTAYVFTGV